MHGDNDNNNDDENYDDDDDDEKVEREPNDCQCAGQAAM